MCTYCPFCGNHNCVKTSNEDYRIVYECKHCDAAWYRVIKEK